jgi:hypothetical protein
VFIASYEFNLDPLLRAHAAEGSYCERSGSTGVSGAFSLRIRQVGREADLSPPTKPSVKVKNSCSSPPPTPLHGTVL